MHVHGRQPELGCEKQQLVDLLTRGPPVWVAIQPQTVYHVRLQTA